MTNIFFSKESAEHTALLRKMATTRARKNGCSEDETDQRARCTALVECSVEKTRFAFTALPGLAGVAERIMCLTVPH